MSEPLEFQIVAGDPHPLTLGEGVERQRRVAFRAGGGFVVQLLKEGELRVAVEAPASLNAGQRAEVAAAVERVAALWADK